MFTLRPGGGIAALVILLTASLAPANPKPSVRYRLLEGSHLVHPDGTLISLRGTFDLITDFLTPDHWFVDDFRGFGPALETLRGNGDYRQSGMPPATHRMMLDLTLNDLAAIHFGSGWVIAASRFPMIVITLWQEPAPVEGYRLELLAVPAYPIWFSTEVGFHNLVGAYHSNGDLLIDSGAIIATNNHLTRNLGIQPVVPDIGLDAVYPIEVDTPPWYEECFSSEVDEFSETLGPLGHGDILEERGFIAAKNLQLTQMFMPMLPEDCGLDALHYSEGCQGWYFSTEVDFFAQALGLWCHHGDVLCAVHGWIPYTNQQLLANFQIVGPVEPDLGLDALFIWPSGEVWFSTEVDFMELRYGRIRHGDLLSDSGWIVRRNPELMARFGALEDLDDFGLDALHVKATRLGDMNGDTFIDSFDIAPFILALTNVEGYYDQYPFIDRDVTGDCNQDGVMDSFDIAAFIALLTGGG